MRVCGLICELDPFHNGHALCIRRLRAQTACEYLVAVMSGWFTQRGEAASCGKWARAEMALRNGADAVFELPCLFSVRDAEHFALGGVSILHGLGAVTHLGFGSETGDIGALLAEARAPEMPSVRLAIEAGRSVAAARNLAAGRPNDALALEYLRALDAVGADMEPVAVRREGAGHHAPGLSALSSATAVRAALRAGEDVSEAVPASVAALLARLPARRPDALDEALLAFLRLMPERRLREACDVSEGLEFRVLRGARDAGTREELLRLVKCKRYTRARLSRVLTQALLSLDKELALRVPRPPYARLLGFRRDAAPLLSRIAARTTLPMVTRLSPLWQAGDETARLEVRAGDLWALGMNDPALRCARRDLTHPIVIID